MLWNRPGIGRVDKVDRERGYWDLDPLHIQSAAGRGWSIHHLEIVTIHQHHFPPF
jgi:hypothetical protein